MKEISRQLVIMGNFNAVTFDSVIKFSELREKYKLQINAMQDIPIAQPIPLGQPMSANRPIASVRVPIVSRPIFQSADKKFNIFFGSNRIHVEELDGDSGEYKYFNKNALEIICDIIKGLELKVNRVALNGSLFNNDIEGIEQAFNKVFKKSDLYSGNSDEWQFHIASKDANVRLGCEINKIAAFTRGLFLDNFGKNQNGLIANYDYNTQVNIDKIFTEEEIILFNDLAQTYREQFV